MTLGSFPLGLKVSVSVNVTDVTTSVISLTPGDVPLGPDDRLFHSTTEARGGLTSPWKSSIRERAYEHGQCSPGSILALYEQFHACHRGSVINDTG